MTLRTGIVVGFGLAAVAAAPVLSAGPVQTAPPKAQSVLIEDLTWRQAEEALKGVEVALVAVGARTKEHGPHLPLKTDYVLAEYLKDRVAREAPVAVFPTLEYGYYPAFVEYPGSVSIAAETFKDTVIDICRSIARHGPHRIYILNTGISTLPPLKAAAAELAQEAIIMSYLDLNEVDRTLPAGLLRQEGGTHADESETSMMLYVAPGLVDMSKAVKDLDPRPGRRGLTRDPNGAGNYSPTGIWGDPTLATREKGQIIVEATVAEIIRQVRRLAGLRDEGPGDPVPSVRGACRP